MTGNDRQARHIKIKFLEVEVRLVHKTFAIKTFLRILRILRIRNKK